MKQIGSLREYLEKNILRQSIYVLAVLGLLAISISYFVSRYKVAQDIQDSAASVAKAYRSRILEGDIKNAQTQLHELLHLRKNEQVLILGADRQPIYREVVPNQIEIKKCTGGSQTCVGLGSATIYFPLYFDLDRTALFGYIYISKDVLIDWFFVGVVFYVFLIGYGFIYFGFSNLTKSAASKLSSEITLWTQRLNTNPKDTSELPLPPFSELQPLRSALEGLNEKIRDFENEASHKAKLLVLRGIAHDLLGPVAQIQFQCASLKTLDLDLETRELVADLNDSLLRISGVATQVKTLQQNNSDFEMFDLSDQVASEISSMNEMPYIKNLGLKLEFSGEPNLQAQVSRAEVSRIVQNLVQNSANASAQDSKIFVKVKKSLENAVIEISDSGCGIASHLQDKVFEPDYTSKPGVGTGLGLAIVKHICSQRNGSVKLVSKPNIGTQVQISLPIFQGGQSAT